MPEELTAVPLDETDREQMLVALRGDLDVSWLHTLIARYDLARAMTGALKARPERVARIFACNPAESIEANPRHPNWHKSHG